jgi:hypothetical protein
METMTPRDILTTSPLLAPEERLKLWQPFKWMWQDRTPDPIEELEHLPPDAAEQHDHYIYGTPKKPARGISLPIGSTQ